MVKWLKIDGGSLCLFFFLLFFGACLYFRAIALICVRFAWETFKWNEWYKCIERTHSRTYAVYHMPFIPYRSFALCIFEITAMKFIWVFNTKRKVHSCTTHRFIRNVSKSVCLSIAKCMKSIDYKGTQTHTKNAFRPVVAVKLKSKRTRIKFTDKRSFVGKHSQDCFQM